MAISKPTRIPIAAVIVAAAALPAGATCALPSTFNTAAYYTPAPAAANALDPASVAGAFWGLGQGVPGVGGTDNGTFPAASPGADKTHWLRGSGPGLYFAGDWSGDTGIHGCIQDPPNPQPAKMVVALSASDTGTRGDSAGYFAVMCVEENASGNFDFGSIVGGSLPLAPTPKPLITVTSRNANGTINITVGAPGTIGPGVYQDGSCGAGLVRGYKIFSQSVPRLSPAPSARARTAGWIESSTGERPVDQPDSFTMPCTEEVNVFLARGLVFDNGFETLHLSENSTRIQCGPNSSGKPDQFRLIKKPKGVRNP